MSSSLLRNTQTPLTLSCRQWLLHRCMHLSTQPSITLEPAALPDSENESVNRRSSKRRQSTKKISHIDEGPPQNRVSLHLEKIRENPLKLEDIETQRPSQIPNSLSADYEEKYRSVIESLDKAFTVKQMHDFLETNKIPLPRRKTKLGLAAQILEQKWGWETLDTVLQRKVDWSQVVEEEFPLDKVEAFLLMGKDGTGARQMSKRYESQVNFILDPMSVKVTGLKGSVKKIGRYLESFKEDIEVENFTLPSNGNTNVDTSTISRVSGAYVKMINDSEVSISFLKSLPNAANIAKRLILQAATKDTSQCTYAVHLSAQSQVRDTTRYSLFPFSPEISFLLQKPSTTTFRYRRVGHTFVKPTFPIPLEGLKDTEYLGNVLMANDPSYDIKNQLLSQMSVNGASSSSLTFTASSGQVLLISPPNQQSTLLPPIPGQIDPDTIFRWINEKPSQVIFHPSVPVDILSAPANEVRITRRIIYRALTPGFSGVANQPCLQKTIELEIPIPNATPEEFTKLGLLENASCVKSTEKSVHVLIPDRQSDIRISALLTQTIPFDSWPEELKRVELHPTIEPENTEDNIPLMFKLDNEIYLLHRDDHVQYSFKNIIQRGFKSTHHTVIMDNSIDHATGTKETSCKTVCEDYITTSGWNDFVNSWSCLASPRPQKAAPDALKPTSFLG